MKKLLLIASVFFCQTMLFGQVNFGLVAHYTFDTQDGSDAAGGVSGLLMGSPTFECGVTGDAMRLDGIDDYMRLEGVAYRYIENENWTITMFVKPLSTTGTENLFSKYWQCNSDTALSIRVLNGANPRFSVKMSENATLQHNLIAQQSNDCWQYVTVTCKDNVLQIWVNGELKQTSTLSERPDLRNNSGLIIGDGKCSGIDGSSPFNGLIDEVRIYARALPANEILELYQANVPTNVSASAYIIFQGQSVTTFNQATSCAITYLWQPSAGVSDVTAAEPVLSPLDTTTYTISFTDTYGCVAVDTITITVLNPDSFPCGRILVPTAFTPNGDGLNDAIFISNAPVIDKLISFEVFDRWGGRVFYSEDANAAWDGTFSGKGMEPAVFLWRVHYQCNGRENVAMGEINLIR